MLSNPSRHRRRIPLPKLPGRSTVLPLLLLLTVLVPASSPSGLHAQPFEIRGRVSGVEGEVPRAAQVELWRAVPSTETDRADLGALPPFQPADDAHVAADGSFRISVAEPGLWTVRVSAPGRIPVERQPFLLTDLRVLDTAILLPAEEVEVLVRDPAGRPVPGVWVEVRPAKVWRQHRERSFEPARRRAVTGDDGRARLPRAVAEEIAIRAFRPGGPESEEVRLSGDELLPDEPVGIVLPIGMPRPLKVRDAAGRPAEGVGVRLGEWSWPAATTDAEGKAQVALSPGRTRVELASPTGWKIDLPIAATASGGPVEVHLPPPVEIVGTVLDRRTEEPLPGVWVWRHGPLQEAVDTAVVTDRAGRFRLWAEPVREVRLFTAAVGYQPWWWDRPVEEGRVQVVFALPPALVVRGQVRDPEGRPVADADVRARTAGWGGRSWKPGRRVLRVLTGPEGRFRIPAHKTEAVELRVEAPGFAPTELLRADAELADPLDIVLRPGAAVAGRAVEPDGAPLPGVAVRIFEGLEPDGRWVSREDRGVARETVSDDDGRFLARHLAAGTYDVELRIEGRAPRLLPGVEPPAGVEEEAVLDLGEVVLEPGVALEGRVVDAEGEPVAEAKVEIGGFPSHSGLGSRQPSGLSARETATDVDGRFRIEDLASDTRVTVRVEAEGLLPTSVPGVELPTASPLEIRLERGARLFGRVVSLGGSPVPTAAVRPILEVPKSYPQPTETDDDGGFDFKALPAGQLTLEVQATGFVPRRLSGLSTAEGRDVGPIEIRLDPGARIDGRVLDPYGVPVVGARVRVGFRLEWGGSGQSVSTRKDGRFEISGGVPPGEIEIVARYGDLAVRREIDLGPAGATVELILEPRQGLTGRVIDPEGTPVGGARVEARPLEPDRVSSYTSVQTDRRGRFHLELEPGKYRVAASEQGFVEAVLEPVVVEEGPPREIELRLQRGATIFGRLTGLEAEELSQVELRGVSEAGTRMVKGKADYAGGYRLSGLQPGSWSVQARIEGQSVEGAVTILTDDREVQLDLHFPQGLLLSGTVLRNEEPVAGARVQLVGPEGAGILDMSAATTGHLGRFRFRGLEPGAYRLWIREPRSQWGAERRIEIWSDQDLVIETWSTRVTGRVLDGEGHPISQVQVVLQPAAREGLGFVGSVQVSTGADGRFVIPAVASGTWRLRVQAAGHGALLHVVTVAGPERDLGDLVLESGGVLLLEPRLSSGVPPPRVWAVLLDPEFRQPVLQNLLLVGPEGRARFEGVPPGSWRLTVFTEETVPATLAVEAVAGGSPDPLPVVLEPRTRLQVEVPELAASDTVARAVVRDGQGEPFVPLGRYFAAEDSSLPVVGGRLDLSSLPAGQWTVEVTVEDGRVWTGTVTTQPERPAKLVLE